MPVIRYIIHNKKELDFLNNIEDIPSETVRAYKSLSPNPNLVSIFIDDDAPGNVFNGSLRARRFISWCYDCDNCMTSKKTCTIYFNCDIIEDVDMKQLLRERKLNRII